MRPASLVRRDRVASRVRPAPPALDRAHRPTGAPGHRWPERRHGRHGADRRSGRERCDRHRWSDGTEWHRGSARHPRRHRAHRLHRAPGHSGSRRRDRRHRYHRPHRQHGHGGCHGGHRPPGNSGDRGFRAFPARQGPRVPQAVRERLARRGPAALRVLPARPQPRLSRALLPGLLRRLRRSTPPLLDGPSVDAVVPASGRLLVILTAEASGSSAQQRRRVLHCFHVSQPKQQRCSGCEFASSDRRGSSPGEYYGADHQPDPWSHDHLQRPLQEHRSRRLAACEVQCETNHRDPELAVTTREGALPTAAMGYPSVAVIVA